MFVHLDDAQPAAVIFVGNRLDTGGLSGSSVAIEQTVIRLFAVDKRFGIVRQLLFLDLIANQVGQLHMRDIGDRHDFSAPVSLFNPECLMQPEPSHAVFLIKFCKSLLHFFRRMVQTEPLRKIADPVADTGIVYLALLRIALVEKHDRKLLCSERFCYRLQIIIIKFLENPDIVKRRQIHAAFHAATDFRAAAIAVFLIYQKICKIAVPEISIKTVSARHV